VENNGKGLYAGRNTVLRQAAGDILAFIDADCVVDREWVERIVAVFAQNPEIVAGTGAHPPLEPYNWVAKLHHWWFIVEGKSGQGYTGGVVGANAYFRKAALEEVGGWISLPLAAAEDVYISLRLQERGYRIWFDERIKVSHHYTTRFSDLIRKSYHSGYAITRMFQAAGIRGYWYYYTLAIPVILFAFLMGVLLLAISETRLLGGFFIIATLGATFWVNWWRFRSIGKTVPRWLARWVIIWGYSAGVVAALLRR